MQASWLTMTGSNPQVRVTAAGVPHAAVDCEEVVLRSSLFVVWGKRTMTLAHSGSLASGAGSMVTVAEQPDRVSGNKRVKPAKNFILNRLPFKLCLIKLWLNSERASRFA